MTLLIQNASYVVLDPDHVERDWDVLIEGNKITRVGPDLVAAEDATTIDAAGCAIIPGLINAHTHLYQNFLKAVPKDLLLEPWCNEVLFPSIAVLREEFKAGNTRPAYLWSALASIEMIRGGTTLCLNMDIAIEEVLHAWQDLGMRGSLGVVLTNVGLPVGLRKEEKQLRDDVMQFINTWHQPSGRIQIALAPSAAFLCDDALLRWTADQAQANDLGVQIHVAETQDEVDDAMRERGFHPVEWLDEAGLVNSRLSAVHCIHIGPVEIEHLSRAGVQVVHCPKSNMKLADGVAPIHEMLEASIPVSLGSDGCASNDLLDMWEEMRSAVFLARVFTGKADALTAADAFRMATIEGARACRVNAGRIEAGRLADLAIVDLSRAHILPFHDLINALVFCARADDVRDTIIDGQIVMRNREIISANESELLEEFEAIKDGLQANREKFKFDINL